MLHDVLSNALLAIGVIVGGTTLLDMLLGPLIKSSIANATIKTWSYLNDLRRIKFLPFLKTENAVFRMSMICVLVNVLIYKDIPELFFQETLVLFFITAPLFFAFLYVFTQSVAQILIPVLLKPASGYLILLWSLLILVISGLITLFLTTLLTSAINRTLSYQWDIFAPHYEPTLITKIVIVIGILIGFLSNIVLVAGASVVGPVFI
jgi:hypothetical protein